MLSRLYLSKYDMQIFYFIYSSLQLLNLFLNKVSSQISTPSRFLNFQPFGANTNVGNNKRSPAFAPASSAPVCPPVLIPTTFGFKFVDFITLSNTMKIISSTNSCVMLNFVNE